MTDLITLSVLAADFSRLGEEVRSVVMQRSRKTIVLVALQLWLAAGSLNAAELRLGDVRRLPAVRTLDGAVIDGSSLLGKAVVISYFATNCPFCANEAPMLEKLYRANKDKLIVIGVNTQRNDPEQRIKTAQWAERYKLTYPVTTDIAAFENAFGKLKGLPVNQIFDRRGAAVRIDIGEIFDEDFDDIAQLAH